MVVGVLITVYAATAGTGGAPAIVVKNGTLAGRRVEIDAELVGERDLRVLQ